MTGTGFCEECGSALSPGAKFCEECGRPASAAPSPPITPGEERLIGIIPYVAGTGAFAKDSTLVVTTCAIIAARWKPEMEAPMRALRSRIDDAIFGKGFFSVGGGIPADVFWEVAALDPSLHLSPPEAIRVPVREIDGELKTEVHDAGLGNAPWTRYATMSGSAIAAEDPGNRVYSGDEVLYIRGESDPDTRSDLILIATTNGLVQFSCMYGLFHIAKRSLFPFLSGKKGRTQGGTGEEVLGVLRFCEEPQVEGFGFRYYWNIVVTPERMCLVIDTEEVSDEVDEYLEGLKKDANRRDAAITSDLGNLPGSPWEKYRKISPDLLLHESEVNFFVPWSGVKSVGIRKGKRSDELGFVLSSGSLSFSLPPGSAADASSLLRRALGDRVSVQ